MKTKMLKDIEKDINHLKKFLDDNILSLQNKIENFKEEQKIQEKYFEEKLKQEKLKNKQLEIEISKQKEFLEKNNGKILTQDDLYYFYIIGDSINIDCFKIGITGNIKSRLSSIQNGNPNKIYLIDFLVGNKENIVQLENTLKEKMSDYNLTGEWFKLEDEDRMKLFNWINNVKLNKKQFGQILDLDIQNNNISNENDISFENSNNDENKEDNVIKKLSKLKTKEIVDLLQDYLKNFNGKLVFENDLTDKFSFDYQYLFEILEEKDIIENDLNKKDFNDLFKKLNNEYLCCFEIISDEKEKDNNFSDEKENDNIFSDGIKLILDDLEITSNEMQCLIGMNKTVLFNYVKQKSDSKVSLSEFESEINSLGYEFKKIVRTNKHGRKIAGASILQKKNEEGKFGLNNKIHKEIKKYLKSYGENAASFKRFDLEILLNDNEMLQSLINVK